MRVAAISVVLACGAALHCGSSDDATPGVDADAGPEGGIGPGPNTGGESEGGTTTDPDAGPDSGAPVSCDAFGHFGVPAKTFTLPSGKPTIQYDDIQASFPDVDWANLERLYVPAGTYKTFLIGNLPKRDAAKPLVITNSGGQVRVGPNLGGNFIWSMNGGSNWILTGRYDPDSKTGDAAFPGHRCGAYATSRDKYGFVSDDALDTTGPYLHMGIAISATDFELEYLEIARSGFAGIRILNSVPAGEQPAAPYNHVRVHDNYIHDTAGEGFYFGWTGAPPSNIFKDLEIYNNRILRTGNEVLQIQDLGDGAHVHHNVFGFGALHWLDNGLGKYQDNCLQVSTREGKIEFDHNVSFGGAGTILSFFSAPQTSDGARNVTFHDNYFADTRSLGGYLNGTSAAGSSFTFTKNYFRGLDFAYKPVDPAATDPGVVFGINGDNKAPIAFDGNTIEGTRKLVNAIALNGTSANVTATNNVNAAVAPIAFIASGYPDVPTAKLSIWGTKASVNPGNPDITYAAGDLVMDEGTLYRAKKSTTNEKPATHAEAWEKLPAPADDYRVVTTSPYAAMGIH